LRDQDSLLQKYLARFSRGSGSYAAIPADDSDTCSVSDTLSTPHFNGFLHKLSNGRHRSADRSELEDSDYKQPDHVPRGQCRRGPVSPVQFDHLETARCDAGYDLEHGAGASMVVHYGSSHDLSDRYIRRRHRSSSSASDMVIYSEDAGGSVGLDFQYVI